MSIEWYVFYTYPKAERGLKIELERLHYEVCLPLHKVTRQWKDRKKVLEQPLFPNYIFVRTVRDKIYDVLSVPKMVKYIAFEGKPATLKEEEISFINQICSTGHNVFVSNLTKGDCIRILDGPLIGYTGILIECDGKKRFGLALKEMFYTIYVDLGVTKFEKMRELVETKI
jgi:transcription antitermination factor NusG